MQERTILLAEDNEENYFVVRSNLKKLDHVTLKWCQDGVETLEALEQGLLPDLLLIDIQMPRMDGIELVKHIRENDQWKHLPLIAVTASVFAEMKERYYEAGFDGILEKPFSRSDLLKTVEPYL